MALAPALRRAVLAADLRRKARAMAMRLRHEDKRTSITQEKLDTVDVMTRAADELEAVNRFFQHNGRG